jgi:transcriptional regulator with PAS, ATPase and Fis domain
MFYVSKDPLIGQSSQMLQLKQKVSKIANLPHPILIRGESGTGKELLAHLIHMESRNPKPMVILNCGAVPANLLYVELFGSTAHAFTGATHRNGLMMKAHQAILFLDEIAELPLEAQSTLLRVLEQKEFYPLGSDQGKKVDFRLICATHRNLEQMIKLGQFREDLYHRIAGIELQIPPLRERLGDLSLLIYQFNEKLAQRLMPDAWLCLRQYRWPGNIRELKNHLLRLEIDCDQRLIYPKDLPCYPLVQESRQDSKQAQEVHKKPYAQVQSYASLKPEQYPSLKAKMVEYIQSVFEECQGNVKLTAQRLCVSKNTVYRYLEHLNDQVETLNFDEVDG